MFITYKSNDDRLGSNLVLDGGLDKAGREKWRHPRVVAETRRALFLARYTFIRSFMQWLVANPRQ